MENIELTRPITENAAQEADISLILPKSRKVYEDSFRKFIDYQLRNGTESFSEKDFLTYFSDLAKTVKSSTLWSNYSMLKSMLNEKHNIDISKYTKLRTFLKQQANGFVPQKSKTLNKEEIEKFLMEAPDNEHLAAKVVLIFGVAGACRCDELYCLKKQHVEDLNNKMLVSLPHTKTNTMRSFVISEYLPIIRKYINSRPTEFASDKFFHKYQNGRGYRQVMGIHTFGRIPKKIASYLKLQNVELYTGHCLRRTSATLVNSGADLLNLKRRRGWRTSTIAEGYIVHSLEYETEGGGNILASSSHSNSEATTAVNIQNESTCLDADMTTSHQDSNIIEKNQVDMWRCRSCFEGVGLIDIFETFIEDLSLLGIIKYCTNEQIPHNSELPSKLCNSCFEKFKETYVFIKEFKQTQEKFANSDRTLHNDYDTKIEIDDNFKNSINNFESGTEISSTDDDKTNIDDEFNRFTTSENVEKEPGTERSCDEYGLFHDHCYDFAIKKEILEETENVEMNNGDFVIKQEIMDEAENIEINNGEYSVMKEEGLDMSENTNEILAEDPSTSEVNATSNSEASSIWPNIPEGSLENFPSHFMLDHSRNEPNRQCFKCLVIFPTVEDLTSHSEETGHDISPKYKCEICGAFFKFGPMYREHIRGHGATTRGLICEICGAYKRPGLPRHMQCDCRNIGFHSERPPHHAHENF